MTSNARISLTVMLAAMAVTVVLAQPSGLAQTSGIAGRYTALAVNFDAPIGASASTVVEFTVKRWSTDAEKEKLFNALLEQGQKKMLDVLRDMPSVGSLSTPGNIGYD